jgi:hypothetical protein
MWDELGIAPCDDPKAIRRAYAARLKKLDPDRDPEAFARLRYALEWALAQAGDGGAKPRRSAAPPPPAGNPRSAKPQSPAPAPDHDEIRDQALLTALDTALQRHNTREATELYYRAAATGALSIENATDVIERLLAVAVDDLSLDATAFRHLTRAVGLAAPQFRAPVVLELRQRVFARLRAEDWYDDLLVKAAQRKGRAARHQSKIARLLLRRIGRYWNPDVDPAVLKSWIKEYESHAAWLGNRIDAAWVKTLDGRLSLGSILGLACFIAFVAALMIQFARDTISEFGAPSGPSRAWVINLFLILFLAWIQMLLSTKLLKHAFPGWTGFASMARLRDWGRRSREGMGRNVG